MTVLPHVFLGQDSEARMGYTIQDVVPPIRIRLVRRIGWAIVWLALGMISINFLLTVYGKYHHLDPSAYTMFWSRQG